MLRRTDDQASELWRRRRIRDALRRKFPPVVANRTVTMGARNSGGGRIRIGCAFRPPALYARRHQAAGSACAQLLLRAAMALHTLSQLQPADLHLRARLTC